MRNLSILCVLVHFFVPFCVFELAAADGSKSQQNRILRKENLILKAELARLEELLQKQRLLNAELAFELKELKDKLTVYEIQAANLKINQTADAKVLEKQFLYRLSQYDLLVEKLQKEAQVFEKYLKTVLDEMAVHPSTALTETLISRYELLKDVIREVETVSDISNEEAIRVVPIDCRIMMLDDDLSIVILDKGLKHRMQPGSEFQVKSSKGSVLLKVLHVRNNISAAVVITGSFDSLGVGAIATAVSKDKEE
ncbi:MAG: hypothetical protein MK193_07970 [Lentisphaeria bacterium]|nr:hypothetical protein [Lentisphaeria bacterium]